MTDDESSHNAFDMYGRIKEGVHVAGYTFERACSHLEWLIDGDRWKLAGRFADINEFLASIKLDQFKFVTDQRQRIAQRIKELQPQATQRTIANVFGAGLGTVNRDLNPVPDGTPKPNKPISSKALESIPVPNGTPPKTAEMGGVAVAKLVEAQTAREDKREVAKAEHELITNQPVVFPEGKFGTIVIDPPWDMQKIEREVRPNQVGFDYPTMTEDQFIVFGDNVNSIAADDCHMFMWTTQKFLPMSLRLVKAWGFRYVLTAVWHKPGGFQPIGLPQYNCEFAVYARKGSPSFVDTKAFNCCFQAPRREHSRKPDEFYDVIRRVTAEGRIDIFSREHREGFAQFGNEIGKFGEAA